MSQTTLLKARWIRDGIYDGFIQGSGIDIGCGRMDDVNGADPIAVENCVHHDKDICDATTMDVFPDNYFDYVYASHVIEHLNDPITAIRNWYRICKPGGHVIIYAPHRDLYEGKKTLPSRWNEDHKFYLLPYRNEPPCTFSLIEITKHVCSRGELLWCKECSEGWFLPKEGEHPNGEFSIEAVIKKR